jgi:hypothetical protein
VTRAREGGADAGEVQDLAGRLCGLGYIELFLRATQEAVDALWNEPDAPGRLRSLVLADGAPDEARFLAAEILAERRDGPPSPEERAVLGRIYAGALARNHTRMGNPWGIPGHQAGQAGRNLVRLGSEAVPALAELLDDETPVTYSGSQEAMLGNGLRLRVKDLALYFLRELLGEPLDVRDEPAGRDGQIETMRARLRERGAGGEGA